MTTEPNKMNGASSNKFFAGLLLGAVIGGTLALLYAPKSGVETRRIVKEKAIAIKEKASNAVSKIKASTDSVLKPGNHKAKVA